MTEPQYDLAVSFAGEQRDYVEQTVRACQVKGLSVFYDRDKNNEWWGHSYLKEQRLTYSSRTRYFVPFISADYLNKSIPMDEFSAAMMTAVKQGDGYILPILVGDVQVPPDLLHPHIHYLRADDYTPTELADELVRKVGQAKSIGQQPAEISAVVEQALRVRLPKVIPGNWSKYRELERIFEHLVRSFREGAGQLEPQGFIATVKASDDRLTMRVERAGQTVAGIDIHKGTQMGDDHITWLVGRRFDISSNGFNGWATPVYNKEQGIPQVQVSGFGGFSQNEQAISYEEFFDSLWSKVIDQIEHAS